MEALILIDLQNDFMPGGALAVPAGDEVVAVANEMIGLFDLVVATRDWHPADHSSFAVNHPGHEPGEVIELDGLAQVLWPVHCVQNTFGAELVRGLDSSGIQHVFFKGTDPSIDSYSAFFDNAHRRATGLGDYLKDRGVDHVYLMGLATDYCVQFSALDAVKLGFRTTVIEDGSRGVELQPGDTRHAIDRMRNAGIEILASSEVRRRH